MKYALRKSLVSVAVILFSCAAYASDTYTLDTNHTNIDWRINHFGFSSPSGKFTKAQGTLALDEANLENSKISVSIPVANLITGVDKLDEHLKSKEFFDVSKFPTATFESTAVKTISKDTAKVTGNLTLHGVTKPVTLDVHLNKIGTNIMGKKTAGFSATTTIKRSDFGMTTYLPKLGDDVQITIESEANLSS